MILKKYLPSNLIYRAQKGETIDMIANKFNTTIDNIKLLSVNEFHEGEFVKILASNEYTHIVKPLEDLNSIAQKYNVTIAHIEECNKLNDKRLFIGQKLRF